MEAASSRGLGGGLARRFLEAHILDFVQYAVHIDRPGLVLEEARERNVGVEQAALVQVPDLVPVVGRKQFGRETAEEGGEVGHVAQQHAAGVVVARRIHRLRQVDDHRTVGAQQNIEFG